jgi:hypothetical protein
LALIAVGLAACSSDDSRIYDAYKCANVANIFSRYSQAEAATKKIAPLLEQKKSDPRPYMMAMREKLTDDLALYKLSPAGQGEKLRDIYESGTCQKLYE